MTHIYSEAPAGRLLNVPPTIPNGMLYRCKQIMGISKQSLKLVSLSGKTTEAMDKKLLFLFHQIV